MLTASCASSEAAGSAAIEVGSTRSELLATTEVFRLGVDESGAVDLTGRHTLVAYPSSANVAPSSTTAPDGSPALQFDGGFLEILNTTADSAGDFEFVPGEDVTLSLYFMSSGNGSHLDGSQYADRLELLGLGDASSNLDVDIGDSDWTEQTGAPTPLWTYYNGGGTPSIVDEGEGYEATHYLDGAWHEYVLERHGSTLSVKVDGNELGTDSVSGTIGAASGARNFIGRESLVTSNWLQGRPGIDPDGAFVWYGYIAGVRLTVASADPDPDPDSTTTPDCVPHVTDCTLEALPSSGDLSQDCVDRINQFRTQCACLPPLARWTEGEACAAQMAQHDSVPGTPAHDGFKTNICDGGSAQNEGWNSDQRGLVVTNLQNMWNEGPPPGGGTCANGDDACWHSYGHFVNMSSTANTKVACGFTDGADGYPWFAQNFAP